MIPELTQSVLQEFLAGLSEDFFCDVICAGGAIRDMWHLETPKDFDLFVLDDACCGEVEEYVAEARKILQAHGAEDIKVYETYRGAQGRVMYVIKFKWQDFAFDLIRYMEAQPTPRAQVSHFDTTLNMFWLGATGTLQIEPEAAAVVKGQEPVRPLRTLDGDPPKRLEYLRGKYPQYKYANDIQEIAI